MEGGDAPGSVAEPATLYCVATPLGNLRDVTFRALDILRSADRIAAEDTRVTATLLARYGIAKRPLALHAHNEAARARLIVAALAAGESVALVSDAGTPAISDPGARLVRAVRDAGFAVVPIPGPAALAAAISAAGLVADQFVFVGFPPGQAKARRALLDLLAPLPFALVFHEAPQRVRACAADLAERLGAERTLVVARELTKVFESITALRLGDAPAWFAADPNRERGEFVLIVDAAPAASPAVAVTGDALRWLDALLGELPPARAARIVAAQTGVPREALYAEALRRGARK